MKVTLMRSSSLAYRSDIDGLRALAVIAVIVFHLNSSWLHGGFLGVDIFFVISGYLITRIIVREQQENRFSFVNFYARRFKRIFPVLFLVILATAIMAILSLAPETYENFFKSARYASSQISNFLFSREVDYFAEGFQLQPLLHTWSLAVEEQFYLVWPLLLILATTLFKNRARRSIIALFLVIICLSLFASYVLAFEAPKKAFYMFYTRAWEFCFGGIFALSLIPNIKDRITNNFLGLFGISLVLGSFIFFQEGPDFLKGSAIIPCLGAALLIYVGQDQKTWIGRCLSIKPIVFIGLLSYSLYLWHWPVIAFFKDLSGIREINTLIALSIVGVTLVLSLLSYYLVEEPSRRVKLKGWIVLLTGIVLILAFAFASKALESQGSAGWRLNKVKQDNPENFSEVCFDRIALTKGKDIPFSDFEKFCVVGKSKTPEILLIGDSHARHQFMAVKAYAEKTGKILASFTEGACGNFITGASVKRLQDTSPARRYCPEHSMFLNKILKRYPSIKIVFYGLRGDSYLLEPSKEIKGFSREKMKGPMRKDITSTIEALLAMGKKVVLIDQVPLLKANPWKCVERTILEALVNKQPQNCFMFEPGRQERLEFLSEIYAQIADSPNVKIFNPKSFIPSAMVEGKLLYLDENHLNEYGSQHLAPPFIKFMESAFK